MKGDGCAKQPGENGPAGSTAEPMEGVIVPAVMMSVLTMITVIRDLVQPEQPVMIAVRIGFVLVIMIRVMNVKAQGHHILPPVTVDALGRRPGKLERNEQHEEDGKDATHGRILLHQSADLPSRPDWGAEGKRARPLPPPRGPASKVGGKCRTHTTKIHDGSPSVRNPSGVTRASWAAAAASLARFANASW